MAVGASQRSTSSAPRASGGGGGEARRRAGRGRLGRGRGRLGRGRCGAAVVVRAAGDGGLGVPPYQTVRKREAYELRVYGAFAVARAEYETRPEGIETLARYFDGGNAEETKLPPTQPLTMRYEPVGEGDKLRKTCELLVAAAEPPASTTAGVSVASAGGELLAVRPFRGSATPDVVAAEREALLAALAEDGVGLAPETEAGAFRVGQFGPIFSLMPRENELQLRVALS